MSREGQLESPCTSQSPGDCVSLPDSGNGEASRFQAGKLVQALSQVELVC